MLYTTRMMLSVHHVHHVPKCMSCHKAIVPITGRTRCFYDYICVTLILLSRDLSTLYVVEYIYKFVQFQKRFFFRLSAYKNQIKINLTAPPPHPVHSFPSTTKHLKKIRFHMIFTLFVNVLKNFFDQKKYNCFKKNGQSFSYSLIPQISKFTRTSLRLVVVIKFVISLYFKVCSSEL